ncbi:MAG: ABC transporter permease [Desulfatirhabdiaceae bacterium]
MKAWINIALRNLIKNKRRSAFTILAITLGFSAVTLFGGFTTYMYAANQEGSIYTSFQGHLTIARKIFFDRDSNNPKSFILSPDELQAVNSICSEYEEVILVTPQLRLNGLITDGRISNIFIAIGIEPEAQVVLSRETRLNLMEPYKGRALDDTRMNDIGVSNGLAKFLRLGLDSEAVIMGTTVDGQMNALDVVVCQLFDAPSSGINDRFVRMPFKLAQSLIDTDGAHLLSIILKNTEDTERIKTRLVSAFSQKGIDLEVKTWNELSEWYTKVKDMFDIIFMFLFLIVFVIVTMSVINTMSMAILERTREIGTLRALGLKRRGVIGLFSIESMLMGFGGIVGGSIVTGLCWGSILFFKPTWTPPGITVRIPLQLQFSAEYIAYSVIFLILLCLVSSLLPARKAAYQNVVDALGHV